MACLIFYTQFTNSGEELQVSSARFVSVVMSDFCIFLIKLVPRCLFARVCRQTPKPGLVSCDLDPGGVELCTSSQWPLSRPSSPLISAAVTDVRARLSA